MRYDEYIRSRKWSAVRKWALERADYRCQVCNGRGNLQVHHRTYENLGYEHPGDVIVLCGACHELHHFPHDGPLVEQIGGLIADLTARTLIDPTPWIQRVLPLLMSIQNKARFEALQARIIAVLDEL